MRRYIRKNARYGIYKLSYDKNSLPNLENAVLYETYDLYSDGMLGLTEKFFENRKNDYYLVDRLTNELVSISSIARRLYVDVREVVAIIVNEYNQTGKVRQV